MKRRFCKPKGKVAAWAKRHGKRLLALCSFQFSRGPEVLAARKLNRDIIHARISTSVIVRMLK